MAKLFPETVPLKRQKCPSCKQDLEYPRYHAAEAVVQAVCVKDDCGYVLDLCWIGDLQSRSN